MFMIKTAINSFFIIVITAVIVVSCKEKKEPVNINLSYTINFEGDSIDDKRNGLKWALSYLGASLKENSFDTFCIQKKNNIISVNFEELGFSEQALPVLGELCDSLKNTEEYKDKNSIDIGAFIALTIGVSKHYYAITNVFPTYKNFKDNYFNGKEKEFAVVKSSVTHNNRKLILHTDSSAVRTAFIAEEGSGSIDSGTFKAHVFEVFDVMPNGQLRFAVYNEEGKLIDGSPASSGQAGKPAKCIWCHELYIQPLFKKTPDVKGYLTENEFLEVIKLQMEIIDKYRSTLKGGIDFTKTQQHTQMELLYISYMEPSVKKLSQEWGIEEEKLKLILENNAKHKFSEFDFLGDLYNRNELIKYSPYKVYAPISVRETIGNDPLFIHSFKTNGK